MLSFLGIAVSHPRILSVQEIIKSYDMKLALLFTLLLAIQ
jgi:hypothetical protein